MDHHVDQPSSHEQTHLDEIELVVLTQKKKRLTCKTLPFDFKLYQHHDELNILLNTAKQLK